MAKVKIVPKAHYDILKQYLGTSPQGGVILVPESVLTAEDFSQKKAELLRQLDGTEIDYNFGGEPDVVVDIILSNDCYALSQLFEEEEGDEDNG